MQKQQPTPRSIFLPILQQDRPQAMAWVTDNPDSPSTSGLVKFYGTPYGGVLIEAEFFNLPNQAIWGSSDFYAMHIHQNGDCSQGFSHTGGHYNPQNTSHPQHAGDLLPLLASQGYAWETFYDKRFQIADILGRSVVIHTLPDDFTSQPSGNSGPVIACGVIRLVQ